MRTSEQIALQTEERMRDGKAGSPLGAFREVVGYGVLVKDGGPRSELELFTVMP